MGQGRRRRWHCARGYSPNLGTISALLQLQAAQARLDALENDNQADDAFGLASDDDEFTLEDEDDGDGEEPQGLPHDWCLL